MTFCSIILCVITDGLVSFIQSTVGRVKIKMDEGHGMPDLECDGCHQVLNCREAFEIPGFPVSVSIGSLFTGLPGRWRQGRCTAPHHGATRSSTSLQSVISLLGDLPGARFIRVGDL